MKATDMMDEDRLRDSMKKLGDAAPPLDIEELARLSARAFSNNAPQRRMQWRVRRLAILTAVFVGLGAMTAYATLNLGQVSFAEYEQAYFDYADCIRAAGYTVEGPTQFGRDPGGHIVLYVGVDPTRLLSVAVVGAPQEDLDSGRMDRIWGQCQVQHVGDLEARWLAQAPVVEPRVWIDRVLQCAAETGVLVPSWLNYDEMLNGVGTDPSDNEIMNIAHQVILAGCRPWEA